MASKFHSPHKYAASVGLLQLVAEAQQPCDVLRGGVVEIMECRLDVAIVEDGNLPCQFGCPFVVGLHVGILDEHAALRLAYVGGETSADVAAVAVVNGGVEGVVCQQVEAVAELLLGVCPVGTLKGFRAALRAVFAGGGQRGVAVEHAKVVGAAAVLVGYLCGTEIAVALGADAEHVVAAAELVVPHTVVERCLEGPPVESERVGYAHCRQRIGGKRVVGCHRGEHAAGGVGEERIAGSAEEALVHVVHAKEQLRVARLPAEAKHGGSQRRLLSLDVREGQHVAHYRAAVGLGDAEGGGVETHVLDYRHGEVHAQMVEPVGLVLEV